MEPTHPLLFLSQSVKTGPLYWCETSNEILASCLLSLLTLDLTSTSANIRRQLVT
jgi:hypothetical protein